MQARTLSPRSVLEMLGPRWALDHEVLRGYLAADAYIHEVRPAVCLDLAAGDDVLTIEIAVDDERGEAALRQAGVMVSHSPTADIEAAKEACALVAAGIPAGARWTLSDEPPVVFQTEITWDRASSKADPDHDLLALDAANYSRLYGTSPTARQVCVDGEAIQGVSIHYPAPRLGRVPASGSIYPVPPHFATRRRFRRYFAAMGVLFDAGGMARTVPTPTTFSASTGSPIRLRMVAHPTMAMRDQQWVMHVVDTGCLPVTVAPRWAAIARRVARRIPPTASIPVDVGMLVHDVSLHAIAFHALPREMWRDLLGQARACLRSGTAPRAIAEFFEGTLTRACWDVWRDVQTPAAFASAIAERTDDLLRGLVAT